jgi:hypothetical protein
MVDGAGEGGRAMRLERGVAFARPALLSAHTDDNQRAAALETRLNIRVLCWMISVKHPAAVSSSATGQTS